MVLLLFFRWWYSAGWLNAFDRIVARIKNIYNDFSLPILLRTIFEPWKQITSYAPRESSFDLKLRVWFDNIFARIIGFVIRITVILFSVVIMIFVAIFGLVIALIWPIVPLLFPLLIIFGVS
jgi:hypothetical protein